MRHMLSSFAAVLAMLGQSAAQAEGSAPSLTGAWSGTYVCAQGRTGLTLTIDRQSGATFSGYFHFYPPRDNPAAREGCFSVNGDVDVSGNVSVKAGRWITQPDGYVTVDLGGTLQGDGMSGNVTIEPPYGEAPWFATCRTFRLVRESERASISEVCRRNDLQARVMGAR